MPQRRRRAADRSRDRWGTLQRPLHRRGHTALRRGEDRDALPQGTGREDGVGNLGERNDGAAERAEHLQVGTRNGGRGFVYRVLETDDDGEEEWHDDRHGEAEKQHDQVSGAEQRGNRQAGRKDKRIASNATGRNQATTEHPTDDTEHKRALEGKVHAVDRGLGDTGQKARRRGRCGDGLEVLVLGAHPDTGDGCGLCKHGGEQRSDQIDVAAGLQFSGEQWHEAPVQAEDYEDLPEATHDGATKPRHDVEDPADAASQTAADQVGQRTDDDERQRNEDDDQEHRGDEAADRGGEPGVKESLGVALQPGSAPLPCSRMKVFSTLAGSTVSVGCSWNPSPRPISTRS